MGNVEYGDAKKRLDQPGVLLYPLPFFANSAIGSLRPLRSRILIFRHLSLQLVHQRGHLRLCMRIPRPHS